MDPNRDWKSIAALALAGLALFVALGAWHGRDNGYANSQASAIPQQIIVQPAAPSTGPTGGGTAPVITVPSAQPGANQGWGGWGWRAGRGGAPVFLFFPLLLVAGVVFLAFFVMGRRRHGWGGPGWYGRPWYGPGPGPGPQTPPYGQPYEQYPQGQRQGQPYGGYPQGQPPQQGYPPQQGSDSADAHGDITRPQRNGE